MLIQIEVKPTEHMTELYTHDFNRMHEILNKIYQFQLILSPFPKKNDADKSLYWKFWNKDQLIRESETHLVLLVIANKPYTLLHCIAMYQY